jgi:hypothetical protein
VCTAPGCFPSPGPPAVRAVGRREYAPHVRAVAPAGLRDRADVGVRSRRSAVHVGAPQMLKHLLVLGPPVAWSILPVHLGPPPWQSLVYWNRTSRTRRRSTAKPRRAAGAAVHPRNCRGRRSTGAGVSATAGNTHGASRGTAATISSAEGRVCGAEPWPESSRPSDSGAGRPIRTSLTAPDAGVHRHPTCGMERPQEASGGRVTCGRGAMVHESAVNTPKPSTPLTSAAAHMERLRRHRRGAER